MNSRTRLIAPVLLIASLAGSNALAQRPGEMLVESFPAPDGVPGTTLQDLQRDRDGFVWIASDLGLIRFDGKSYTTFTAEDGLPADRFRSLYRNRLGDLYAVSDHGVVRIEPAPEGIRFNPVTGIGSAFSDTTVTEPGPLFQDEQGMMWGSDKFRVFRIEKDELISIWMPDQAWRDNESAGYLFSQFDEFRILVLSRTGQMALLDTRNDSLEPFPAPRALTRVLCAMSAGSGRVLVGASDGVYEVRMGRSGAPNSRRIADTPPVATIARLSDGTVVLGTEFAGLMRLDEAGTVHPLPTLPVPGIRAAVPDADGRLFVLTSAGVSVLWRPFFDKWMDVVSSAIAPMDDYFGGGLLYADEDRVRLIRTASTDPDEQVLVAGVSDVSTVASAPDAVWVGTRTGMVLRAVRGRSPVSYRLPSGEPVSSLEVGSDGSLWVAQRGRIGVTRVRRDGAMTEYGPDRGVRGQVNVLRVLGDQLHAGITARSEYVLRFDTASDRFVSMGPTALAEQPVEVLDLATESGRLWVGTSGGLFRLDNLAASSPESVSSLRDVTVLALAGDPANGLWIGTSTGLFRLVNDRFASYELMDGTSELGVSHRAIHVDSRGRPWVGTNRTLSWWHDRPTELRPTPKPRLRALTADGIKMTESDDVSFGVVISAIVEAPTYPGQHISYRHRLQGLSDAWSPESDEPAVQLMGLNEDSYVLEIQARQVGYSWSPSARIPFTIRAPWYRSGWMVLVLFLFGAFTVFAVLHLFTSVNERHKVEQSLLEKAEELSEAKSDLERTVRELDLARGTAERAVEAKSAFLASMSHEIRTPMSGVIGMTSLLDQSALTPEQQEYVTVIRSSGESLLGIINDILDFSKIEAGRVEMDMHPFGIRRLVESAVDTIAHAASSKGVEVTYLIRPGVPSRLTGDSTRLRQVLINLLSNAVKFTENGHVTIQIDNLPGGNEDHHLAISVTDTGLGIPPNRVNAVFDRFTQVDAATSRHYGGTGLGLPICKRLVELMEGEISVESEVGKGSTFKFDIWLGPADGTDEVDDVPLHVLEGNRVLLVESSTSLRRMVRHEAAVAGLQVKVAESAEAIVLEDVDSAACCLVGSPGDEDFSATIKAIRERVGDDLPIIRLGRLGESAPDGVFLVARPLRRRPLLSAIASALTGRPFIPETTPGGDPAAPTPEFIPLNILVVDDNPINMKVAARMLERLGYSAVPATSGMEAIDAVQKVRYDLILMDIRMPDMDGIEAAKQIREVLAGDRIPRIVAMTANTSADDQAWYKTNGMDDFLGKPFSLEAMGSVIARATGRPDDALSGLLRAPDRRPVSFKGGADRFSSAAVE